MIERRHLLAGELCVHARPPHDRGTGTHARSRSRPLPLSLPPTSLVHLPCVRIWCAPHATRASTLGLPVRRGADLDRFLVRDSALHVCTEMITLRHTVPLPLLARSATPFFAAGIRGFETIGDRALAGAAPFSTCARPHPLRLSSRPLLPPAAPPLHAPAPSSKSPT